MRTIIEKLDENQIDEQTIARAGEVLKSGGLVAFPTETVYGLGANALDERAAERTYAAKGRPSDNPLIVHIADAEALESIVRNVPEKAYAVIEHLKEHPEELQSLSCHAVELGRSFDWSILVKTWEDVIMRIYNSHK